MEAFRQLSAIDLNLLMVFRAIDEERHVTRAARLLGISQPALSHALGRLRDVLDDQLFVKSSRGMVPTPKAERFAAPIREILDRLGSEIFGASTFAPEKLDRTFRVKTTDLIESLILPRVLSDFASAAPQVRVVMTGVGFGLPKEVLENGQCDLAIAGFFGELPDGFFQQKLVSDSFVCAVRKSHPRLGKKNSITLDQYCDERHVLIAPGGELGGKIDATLKTRKKKRTVVAGLSSFMVSGWMVSQSDCLITAPSRLIQLLEKNFSLTVFEPPLSTPKIDIVQVWHERNHEDPAHKWFRAKLASFIS